MVTMIGHDRVCAVPADHGVKYLEVAPAGGEPDYADIGPPTRPEWC